MHATVYLENEEYIALCDLLKLAGLAESGGQAKSVIAEGLVLRNGAVETRKTAKIRGGPRIGSAVAANAAMPARLKSTAAKRRNTRL